MRSAIVLAVGLLLAVAHPAAATVIDFRNPDLVLADPLAGTYCSLGVIEQGGVRVAVHDLEANFVTCDTTQPPVVGPFYDALFPATEHFHGPIYFFAADPGGMLVTSLTGDAIRGINIGLNVYRGHGCTLLVGPIPVSCDLWGYVNFADFGYANGLTQFGFVFSDTGSGDPILRLNSVTVPEPPLAALLGLAGLAQIANRRRRRARSE